jgi:hypothetical protein
MNGNARHQLILSNLYAEGIVLSGNPHMIPKSCETFDRSRLHILSVDIDQQQLRLPDVLTNEYVGWHAMIFACWKAENKRAGGA